MGNFQFSPDFKLPQGAKRRAIANIQAIRLLKDLEKQGRPATEEEQVVLAKYVGWGGLPQIFNPEPQDSWQGVATELREVLERDEYDAAFESVLNAHYTRPEVIRELYQGLQQLGFSGGRILEPSLGTGNFLGHLPMELSRQSQVTGIELDSITGRIAQQLYPDHEIYVQGFQETPLPKDSFDLAISNVPFGDYKIADPEYDALNLRIHNYFFARSLDRVRPGGLVAFITSTGTLQSKSGKGFRVWLAERANLVGAMRLPGEVFKETAGTEVTTDLIILQKLAPDIPSQEQRWIDLADTSIQDADGNVLQTNEYYIHHPEMMLGELADDKLHPGRLALVSDGQEIGEAMQKAFKSLPRNLYRRNFFLDLPIERTEFRLPVSPDCPIKQFGYGVQDDELWQRRGDWLYPANLRGKTTERVKGMIQVRDAVQQVFEVQLQGGSDDELQAAQVILNQTYDDFVQRLGRLSETANIRAFQEDPDAQLLIALEQLNKETGELEKTDVFSERTVRPRLIKRSAETPQEALLSSLNEYGSVVPGYMAQLLGEREQDALAALVQQKLVFQDPTSFRWLTEDEYLSGEVRRKLAIAQTAAQSDPRFQVNVEALQSVQPRDLGPGEIEVRLGAPWIPTEVIADFAQDLLEVRAEDAKIEVSHSSEYAVWAIEFPYQLRSNARNNSVYGTSEITALELIELSLNLKDAAVYQNNPDGTRSIDTQPTLAARLKQQQVQDQFKIWIWQDFERSEKLCQLYNELYNGSVVRQFRNPNLEMPGSSAEIELRPHQKDAVWRILQSDASLLAHVVGAGKTFTMIAGALELRRLNLAQKPMIVVPNHMLGQFTRELYQLYPNAKVLAPTEKDTQKNKRKQLMARIATGDWDAVIVTHSAFTRLPVSKAEQRKYLQDQLDELNQILGERETRRGNGVVKQLARERQKLKQQLAKVNQSNKDDGVTFEQLGIDALFVDEAHFWKNLGRASKLRNIAGLSNTNSQRAMDALIKTRLVRRRGGRLIFATGTPISNSIAEMYTMQRFLQPETLKEKKINSFDAWVGNFAEKVTAPEIDPTGRFKTKTRLTRFTNVPELMTLFRDVADIRTAEQLKLPRPEAERFTLACGASPLQLQYMTRLIERAEAVAAKRVEPDEDNMLWVTTDGRRAALDPRLIAPQLPDYPHSKVNQAIANIHAIWQATAKQQLTQMVFCDMGTPKQGKEDEPVPFSVYQHIRAGLIHRGVPAEDIAFIHDAATSKDKELLYTRLREGQTRILLGSTEKCGVGMNIQTRLIAEHHLDPPWRPADIEQREGRILRQGNQNPQVMILTYVTQGRDGQLGFDSYSWQTLARKAEMVAQVMNGETAARSVDDISSQALTFDEVKAIATGNLLIIEKANVDNRVSELARYQQVFMNERYTAQRQLNVLPGVIADYQEKIRRYQQDLTLRQPTQGDAFHISIGSKVYRKRKEAGAILLSFMHQAIASGKTGTQTLGQFAGFELAARVTGWGGTFQLRSPSSTVYEPEMRDTPQSLMRSFESTLDKIPDFLYLAEQKLAQSEASLATLSQEIDKPFEYEQEYQQQLQRQFEINKELGLFKDDEQGVSDPSVETEQEQDLKSEDQQTFVDLESLASSDRDWDWNAVEMDWEHDAVCAPSPEVQAAIAQLFDNEALERDAVSEDQPEKGLQELVDSDAEIPVDENTLNRLRCWYFYAQALERPYLDRIQEVGQEFKQGVPLSEQAIHTMEEDKSTYSQAIAQMIRDAHQILNAVGQSLANERVYAGQTYALSCSSGGELTVIKQGRDVILRATAFHVTSTKAVKQDFQAFQQFCEHLNKSQVRKASINAN
ncbi:SNF2-related protein [Lyngbya confervoides]|uniref:SNF2-related protein n=1 Tax=Lyngbya confervoides BDU141951 TaxID=1574623 RepID=A0ABD4TAA1_9CYAN|nr:SNF2-related protein [Lyngbya confervoides]MCM1985105.1 SNF2-related protein [Lyngbya confervoides BDU141951]